MPAKPPVVTTGPDTFDRLRWAAEKALATQEARAHFNASDRVILYRIRRNCDQLKGMILKVHEKGVDVSLRHWQTIFDIVKQVAGSLTNLFLNRG